MFEIFITITSVRNSNHVCGNTPLSKDCTLTERHNVWTVSAVFNLPWSVDVLGYNEVWACRQPGLPVFRRNILPPFSALKMTHKRWYLPTSSHNITNRKTTINIFATLRMIPNLLRGITRCILTRGGGECIRRLFLTINIRCLWDFRVSRRLVWRQQRSGLFISWIMCVRFKVISSEL
jgi:hypothetical protein